MSKQVVVKALEKKKRKSLTNLETEQIEAFRKVYGTNLVIMAIRYSKPANIKAIGRLLLQMGGFRDKLHQSLDGVIPDTAKAQKLFSEYDLGIAARLRSATRILRTKDIEELSKRELGISIYKLWLKHSGKKYISEIEKMTIERAIKKHGLLFTKRAFEEISPDFKIEEFGELFRYALMSIGTRDFDFVGGWSGIPHECPIRIELYFEAKKRRKPNTYEKVELVCLANKFGIDSVIYAMSCIPARNFSTLRVDLVLTDPDLLPYADEIEEYYYGNHDYEDWGVMTDLDYDYEDWGVMTDLDYDYEEPEEYFYDYSNYDPEDDIYS
jgi:hypothetical protein